MGSMSAETGDGAMDAVQSIQEVRSAAEKFREEPPGIKVALPLISWGLVSAAGFATMQVLFSSKVSGGWAYLGVGAGMGGVGALAHLVITQVVGKPKKSFFDRAIGGLWFYLSIAMGSAGLLATVSDSGMLMVPACVMLMLAAGYGVMGVIQGLKYFCALGLIGFGLAYAMAAWSAWWPLGFVFIQVAGLLLPGLWILVGAKKCPKTSTTS
jgi:hypothetical protein